MGFLMFTRVIILSVMMMVVISVVMVIMIVAMRVHRVVCDGTSAVFTHVVSPWVFYMFCAALVVPTLYIVTLYKSEYLFRLYMG